MKLIGKLSKGYRQRVGLAQAIIHNPDVLILDEPTSGLDPKQIIEIRELLRSLAGEHTIILSTHILSEVEHTCERVIIIDRGRLVAIDSVANLTNRLRGAEAVAVEVEAAGGQPNPTEVQQRLEQVPGVSRVVMKDSRDGRLLFEVESLQGRHIRAELARSVVSAGWNLNELRAWASAWRNLPAAHRGRTERERSGAGHRRRPDAMKNVLLICRKELKSYFASPIAYAVMAIFGLIFGWVFFNATRDFIRYQLPIANDGRRRRHQRQRSDHPAAAGLRRHHRPVFGPHDHHAPVRRRKAHGHHRAAAHFAGQGYRDHPGQVAGRGGRCSCVLLMSMLNIALLFAWGKPDLKPVLVAYLGLLLQGGCLLAIGALISTMTRNQIIAGIATFFVSLLLWLLSWSTAFDSSWAPQLFNYLSIVTHFENFAKGVIDSKDVVFYLSMIFFSLFLTSRSLESLRWRA